MFYLPRETELTKELLYKMITKFRTSVEPQLVSYKQYFDGNQEILKKAYADTSKPCSRLVVNYCANIVGSFTGYLATPGHISYQSDDDIEDIMNILRYNDYQEQDANLLQDALTYGVAAELMYIDDKSQTRFRNINPTTCFGIYDDSLTADLIYFVRMYKVNNWEYTDTYRVDVYSDYDIKHYTMSGKTGALSFEGEEPHFFSQVPANIMVLEDEKSIFDCILTLQDGYNQLISAELDEFNSFADAYLALIGVDAEADDIAAMKENRVLLLPQDASAQWVTKAANDAQVENMLKRLQDAIYKIAQCPDFSSESFVGGVSSGIAIQYRLTGMETRAGKIEAIMKKALQRRIEIICGIASLKIGEEVFRDIKIEFKRNIPEDITTTINLVNSLKGSVSDATLLSQLSFIDDVNTELEALQEQRAANMAVYGFGAFGAENNEEVDE